MAYEPLNDIIDDVFVARVASSLIMINILSRFFALTMTLLISTAFFISFLIYCEKWQLKKEEEEEIFKSSRCIANVCGYKSFQYLFFQLFLFPNLHNNKKSRMKLQFDEWKLCFIERHEFHFDHMSKVLFRVHLTN